MQQIKNFTNVDHDFTARDIHFDSGSRFSDGETFGKGAYFAAGIQTFTGSMTFDEATEFANSQIFNHTMTFDKHQHFGDATDFRDVVQTFKEGTTFGDGTKFKSDGTQSIPVGTIPSFGVMLESFTCVTEDCMPTDASKFLPPGGLLPVGTDPAPSYSSVSTNDKSFTVDGLGLTMSFDSVSGDGTIKTVWSKFCSSRNC